MALNSVNDPNTGQPYDPARAERDKLSATCDRLAGENNELRRENDGLKKRLAAADQVIAGHVARSEGSKPVKSAKGKKD